jgi:hypothetical protein
MLMLRKFAAYRDHQRLIKFLMALIDDFISVPGSILHPSPPPRFYLKGPLSYFDFISSTKTTTCEEKSQHLARGIWVSVTVLGL